MVTAHGGGHGIVHPLEVVETVLEVADVAWNAYGHRRHRKQSSAPEKGSSEGSKGDEAEEAGEGEDEDKELSQLQEENRQLRSVLEENLALLQRLSKAPSLSVDCPPDLYSRLLAAVDSASFLNQLEALNQTSSVPSPCFPFKAQEQDLKTVDILTCGNYGDPNNWDFVSKETDSNMEELSGIDNDSYIIICEEHVVDGIANFIAKCIVENPKSKKLTPEELQKIVLKALGDMKDWAVLKKLWHAGKLIYGLSTWGIALAGLYRHPAIVMAVAKGIGATGKFVLKAL